jgi:hypothetical protein
MEKKFIEQFISRLNDVEKYGFSLLQVVTDCEISYKDTVGDKPIPVTVTTNNPLLAALKPLIEAKEQELSDAKNLAHQSFENRIFTQYSLNEYIKQNPDDVGIVETLIRDYARISDKLQEALAFLKSYDNGATVKEVRIDEDIEYIFIFERKIYKRNKSYLVGKNEKGEQIALSYAYLLNMEKYSSNGFIWELGECYLIKNNGLFKKRKKDIGYYTFSVSKQSLTF